VSAWRETPTLIGPHVSLRPLSREDREGLLETFSDGLDGVFATIVPNAGTIDGWYDTLESEKVAGRALPFTVRDAEGRIAGCTRYLRMAEQHKRLEIGGTVYAKRVQRSGLNTNAKRLLLGHAFEVMGAQCVQFRTSWFNRESRAAIERLGAKMDGVLRGHMIMPDGYVRDTVVYSVLAHEWPGVRLNLDRLMARHEGSGA
jgi:N-acetyltransferase